MDTLPILPDLVLPAAPSSEAGESLRRFTAGVQREQAESRARGVPYAVMDEQDRMVWVHPDGSRRTGFEPASDMVA